MAPDPQPFLRLPRWLRLRRGGPMVPAVRLQGIIGSIPLRGRGLTIDGLERSLEAAFAVKRAPAVALIVNSPGGSAAQSSLIAGRIRQLAREKGKPVLAFVEDVAASGGYWLATAADEIYADASSIVGSIGVVSQGFGFADAISRIGVERRVHTAGTRKALLDPFRPEDPADLALLAELQGDIHGAFKEQVRSRRGARLKLPESELFEGRVWTGARAVEAGLIDGLGDIRSTLRARFGDKVRIAVVNRQRGWLIRRFSPGAFAADAAVDVLGAVEERLLYARYGL